MGSSSLPARRALGAAGITVSLIGWLAFVELTSGVLQGYYVPLVSDIVRHLGINDADFNWFEAGQLLLSALVVPILAKLGDMFGHKRILLITTALTAAASWALVFADSFPVFLLAWALQGFYVVWLPLEIALIFDRGRRTGAPIHRMRRAAGLLIVALEGGAILGAVGSGLVFDAVEGALVPTLMVPAICVTVAFFAVLLGVPASRPERGRQLDLGGFVLLSLSLVAIMSGLTFLRLNGPGSVASWAVIVVGVALLWPFGRHELRHPDPAIDLRVVRRPQAWPIHLTAGLVGISLLGAQAPLSTYAGTDPALGYGLGLPASARSLLIGAYLLSMIVGALAFAPLSRRLSPRTTLIAAATLVAIGYLLFLPFHLETLHVYINMSIAGIGAGALMGALPAAAAASAPPEQTGAATALTNTTKTIGGAFASAVFGMVLLSGVAQAAGVDGQAASLGGYMIVWAVCGLGAAVAAVLLFVVPRQAFAEMGSVIER